MSNQKIEIHKVTKPIQLLAAWLVGLILVNGSFLAAASTIAKPEWAAGWLVGASVANVPIFLAAIFLLQTKFRPEMQEDTFYSKYLEQRTGISVNNTVVDEINSIRKDVAATNDTTLNLIQAIGENVVSLTAEVSSLSKRNTVDAEENNRIENLKYKMNDTEKQIKKAKVTADWNRITVEMNDLIPNYSDMKNRLLQNGISVDRTFGSTSNKPEIPKELVLSFGDDVDIHHIRAIVNALLPLGIKYIDYANEDISKGRIYVGSYAYKYKRREPYELISEKVLKILNDSEATINDIKDMILEKREALVKRV